MKPAIASLVTAFAIALSGAVLGCAAEESEAEEAAYPPVGYTLPRQPRSASTSAPAGAAFAQPEGTPTVAPSIETSIGGDDESAPQDGTTAAPGYSDADPAALSDFRSTLDPYGSWAEDATYGTVWVPSRSVVGDEFTPYVTAGHWVYDDDYAWVSDYDWGWAPFHYGRWVYAAGPGWEWIPGRQYAGAWVSWRCGFDDWAYVGWAPLAPTWGWRGGVAVGFGFVPVAPYAFVGTGELFYPTVGARVIAGPQVGVIASHTQPYAAAAPAVGGRFAAKPSVGGPPPSSFHLAPDAIARSSVDNKGLAQARAFARPETAVALGARSPQGAYGFAASGASARWSQARVGANAAAYDSSVARSQIAYAPPSHISSAAPSHFGGRLGSGFAGSASSAPPMRSPAAYGSYREAPRPYFGAASRYAAPSPSFRPSPSVSSGSGFHPQSPASLGVSRSMPSVSGAARAYPSSNFRGGASTSSGGFHGASNGFGGGFHGGGTGHGGGRR